MDKFAAAIVSEADVLAAADDGKLTVPTGRPEFQGAPPDSFICPLNGRV